MTFNNNDHQLAAVTCNYKNKVCHRPRSVKKNGEPHSLCTFHRHKATLYQRSLRARRKNGRAKKLERTDDRILSELHDIAGNKSPGTVHTLLEPTYLDDSFSQDDFEYILDLLTSDNSSESCPISNDQATTFLVI